MCIDIFKDTGKAFAEAAKHKKMQKTAIILLESSIIAAIASFLVTFKTTVVPWVFLLVIVVAIITGFIVKITLNALGAKGGFFEGLTAVSYALIPTSVGLLLISIFALLPLFGIVFGAITSAILFSLAFAVFYRGVRELFKTDMITAFVTLSIIALAFIIAMQFSFSLNLLTNISGLVGGIR